MNYLDLFSGIGGFHKGLEEAGFKFGWSGHSEIDKYAKSIYQSHFKESEDLGDVSNINIQDLPRSKKWIVTGGWPCQDNSIAGKRKGQRGSTRSGLLSQIIRLTRELIEVGSEVIFVGENVKGLFSVNNGVDFLDSIRGLTYLDKDSPQLTLEMQLLNTRWFLPQNRERVYFVGYTGNRSRTQVFPIGEEHKRITEGPADTTVVRAFTAGGNSGGKHSGMTLLQRGRGFNKGGVKDICPTISTSAFEQNNHINMPVANCVTPDAYLTRGERNRDENGKAVLTSMCERRIRRLTPIECERLQGFPDGWTAKGKDGEIISDTQRYKTLGNAVSVPVVKAVGERLI